MVLLVNAAVSIARVQGGPLVVRCKAAIGVGQGVVENGPSIDESNGAHRSSGWGSVLGWGSRCSKVLIANACNENRIGKTFNPLRTFRMVGQDSNAAKFKSAELKTGINIIESMRDISQVISFVCIFPKIGMRQLELVGA